MNDKVLEFIECMVKRFIHDENTLDFAYHAVIKKCKEHDISLSSEDNFDIQVEIFSMTKNLLINQKLQNSCINFCIEEIQSKKDQKDELKIEKIIDKIHFEKKFLNKTLYKIDYQKALCK